jgi:hypothetical protein
MFDALPKDEQREILDSKAIKTQAKVANDKLPSDPSPSKKAPDPEKLAKVIASISSVMLD